MRSPQTMGDDIPVPGSAVFHATLLSGPHVVGTPVSSEMPCPPGPRHCGQFAAAAMVPAETTQTEIMPAHARIRDINGSSELRECRFR